MPAAPVVRRPAQSPVLNTLPGARESGKYAPLLAYWKFISFFLLRISLLQGAEIPSASWSPLDTGKKKASRLFRKMEVTVNNPVGVRRD